MSNDHWEISNLIARYAELLNLGQIDEVAELFRHGKITSEGNPTAREGSEAVAEMYLSTVVIPEKLPDTLIFTTNLQIEVDGDRATGKAYFLAMHQTERGVAPVIAGRYHDEFQRIDGKWWFAHRHMLPDLTGDLSTHLTRPLGQLQDEARVPPSAVAMERGHFGNTDLEVSSLCLGAMNFGTPGWGCNADAAADIVRAFRDAGGNFFDTANIYGGGESERILGRLVAGSRDDVVLASKVGFPAPGRSEWGLSPSNLRGSLEGTLERLGTDHLDLYQLHSFDGSVPLEDTLGTLHELVDEGLIRYAGCSNFFAWQIAHADALARTHELHGLVSAQMMYSLVRRDLEREHLGYARATGLALIAYGPLHGGHLAAGWRSRAELPPDSRALENPDVYLADEQRLFTVAAAVVAHAEKVGATPGQVALAWVLRNPDITSTLTAARSADELQEQLVALVLDADDEFWTSLDDATALPPSYPADFYARLTARPR